MARRNITVRTVFATALAGALVLGGITPAGAISQITPTTSLRPAETDATPGDALSGTEAQAEQDTQAEDQRRAERERELQLEREQAGRDALTEVEGEADPPADTDAPEDETEPQVEMQLSPMMLNVAPLSAIVTNKGLWGDTRSRRLGGPDRYQTAALISKDAYPNAATVKTVVVATGTDFPDALSAAPLAARLGAPLLMTQPTVLTAATKVEIQRLKPDNIIVIGGTGAVSNAVAKSLNALLPSGKSVTRIGGIDRYETSVLIAKAGWTASTQSDVFFVTGADFPDALSAGAAAGSLSAPVILVPGSASAVGPQTRSFVTSKKATTIHIVGGTGVVSKGIETSSKNLGSVKTVKRYAGSDRYGTTAAVANAVFSKATNTYFANAFNFPDALAGAAVAGAQGAPLLLTGDSCIPSTVYDANDRLVPGDTVLLGGTGVLKGTIQHGNECMTKPGGSSSASYTGMQQLYAKINKARYDAGLPGFRVADTKAGTPAYSWAAGKKLSRNASLAKQQPWVRTEAVARSSAATKSQVNALYSMFITDTKNGVRTAILRTYGGARGYISVGYVSASTGYATIHIGTAPK